MIRKFYHGTNNKSANSILNNGIDINKGRNDADFGLGFYMTEDFRQAQSWAKKLFGDDAAVVSSESKGCTGCIFYFLLDSRVWSVIKITSTLNIRIVQINCWWNKSIAQCKGTEHCFKCTGSSNQMSGHAFCR